MNTSVSQSHLRILTVISALAHGLRVTVGDHTLALGENNRIGWVVTVNGEEMVAECDLPLNAFTQMCEQIPDDVFTGIACDIAVTSFLNKDRPALSQPKEGAQE